MTFQSPLRASDRSGDRDLGEFCADSLKAFPGLVPGGEQLDDEAPLESDVELPEEAEAMSADLEVPQDELEEKFSQLGDASELWRAYWVNRNSTNHARLFDHYLPFLRYLTERMSGRVPDEVDAQDLFQDGAVGLMEQIEKFDPTRNVRFETFAAPRINGAMQDGLRKLDWVPRLVRYRSARVREVEQKYLAVNGTPAAPEDLKRALRLDDQNFEKYRLARRSPGSPIRAGDLRLRANHDSNDESGSLDQVNFAGQSDEPSGSLERREVMHELMRSLASDQREVLRLYLYEELTLKEIGSRLGMSESRISQLFTALMAELTARVSRGRSGEGGSLFTALCEEYGPMRGVREVEGGCTLPDEHVKLIDEINSGAPTAYQLGVDREGYGATESDDQFHELVNRVSAKQTLSSDSSRGVVGGPNDFDFIETTDEERLEE